MEAVGGSRGQPRSNRSASCRSNTLGRQVCLGAPPAWSPTPRLRLTLRSALCWAMNAHLAPIGLVRRLRSASPTNALALSAGCATASTPTHSLIPTPPPSLLTRRSCWPTRLVRPLVSSSIELKPSKEKSRREKSTACVALEQVDTERASKQDLELIAQCDSWSA